MFVELRRRCVLLDAGTKYPGIGQPAALGMLAAAVVGLVALPSVREHVLSHEASLIVTYVAVAAGAAGGMLIEIVALLARHRRAVWLSAALALYSLVVVPFATVQTASEGAGTVQSVTRLVAYWTVALLLLLALRPPRVTSVWTSWSLAGCGWLLTLAAAEVETPTFGAMRSALSSNFAHMALVVAACLLVTALAVNGWQERSGPFRQVGQGLLLIAAAHLYWIASGFPAAEPNIIFMVLRLFGLALILAAAVRLVRRTWRAVRIEHSEQKTKLQLRGEHLQRMVDQAVERDHELRNALAGLASVPLLLERSVDAENAERLRHAVTSELGRLEAMLGKTRPEAETDGYLVAPVLRDLVTLHRSAGRILELDVDEQLSANGSPKVLAQVVTNLLANCERHAFGSTVRIRAGGDQDRVRIEVADDGPGVPPGLRDTVLERGVHGDQTEAAV